VPHRPPREDVALSYEFDAPKDPPGEGRSYPLKCSALDAALTGGRVTAVRRVKYLKGRWSIRNPSEPMPVVAAEYAGTDHWIEAQGTVVLTVYSVPRSDRHAVEGVLMADGLSRLVAWIQNAENETETWRETTHRLALTFDAGNLLATED
jgi:hypothetical protein